VDRTARFNRLAVPPIHYYPGRIEVMPHNESMSISPFARAEHLTINRLITICKVIGMTDAETKEYIATGKIPDRLRSDA
jgi:hypothetical protein